jgi:hypothetical protein
MAILTLLQASREATIHNCGVKNNFSLITKPAITAKAASCRIL